MNQIYQNSASNAIPVYADSGKAQQVGRLFAGSSCLCIGEQDGLAILLYKINVGTPGSFKVGFADAAGIRNREQACGAYRPSIPPKPWTCSSAMTSPSSISSVYTAP